MISLETVKAVILGHAVADALGLPVQFYDRIERDNDPVTDMREYGVFSMPKGSWSDDTSLSLCALDSLAKGNLDYEDIMKNFGLWYFQGEFTPLGFAYDIGGTCAEAIESYFLRDKGLENCGGREERSNGNGSLMRIHPFVLYQAAKGISPEDGMADTFKASALTHAHNRSKLGCGIYACVLNELLCAPTKTSVYRGLELAKSLLCNEPEFSKYSRLFDDDFAELPRDSIISGGYVVTTLEAALWCLLTTDSYRACVLKAVNLGKDTDTVAAVTGGLAGALYGLEGIPADWLEVLMLREYIEALCERASSAWSAE